MTQEATPVGGSDEPIIAAEPTIEDRFAALPEEEEETPEAPAAEGEPELTEEDVTEEDEAETPITPPVSWTGEQKEKFATLPRDVQEYIAERETQREKFVQTKAQEAKSIETRAQAQAAEAFQNVAQTFAQQITALRVALPERPSHQLQADDPYTYAEQMDAYERSVAHNQWIEQQVGRVTQQLRQVQSAEHQREQMETLAALQQDFPEYLDNERGPELRQKLGSTAQSLGYSAEQIAAADHNDIKAMRTATEWREKAEKYDRLMSKKMERVREAKTMPKVSRPGTAQAPGQAANQRYSADREAMRRGDRDAAAAVFGRFL
jgi:hypothetical protein